MNTTQTHTPGPQWCGAYKADGTLAAILASESEAYFYIRNRGHMHGGTYRPPSGTAHFHIYVCDPGHPASGLMAVKEVQS